MYAADILLQQGLEVDVFDKLPVPFGLVRYGVAPDHVSIRSVRDTLDQVWDKPGIRFFGNVEVGRDFSIKELRSGYEALILTYGASSDRRLGIEGEDLARRLARTQRIFVGGKLHQRPTIIGRGLAGHIGVNAQNPVLGLRMCNCVCHGRGLYPLDAKRPSMGEKMPGIVPTVGDHGGGVPLFH